MILNVCILSKKTNVTKGKILNGHQTCTFNNKINLKTDGAVYILVHNNEIMYIGQTSNINRRWNRKYGHPQKTTSTNIRINNYIYEQVSRGEEINLYVCYTENHKEDEKVLIGSLFPGLNK